MPLRFGYGAISKKNWEAIKKVLDKENIQSVIEFGAGMSSKCFYEYGVDLVSLETKQKWVNAVEQECPGINIVLWDNKRFPVEYLKNYDLAFVDGKVPRTNQAQIAKLVADRIIFHDGGRKNERLMIYNMMDSLWQEMQIAGNCRYFKRKIAQERVS